jgi:hypothetical protein
MIIYIMQVPPQPNNSILQIVLNIVSIILFYYLIVYSRSGFWFPKKCPFCKNKISRKAMICQFCHAKI